MLSLPIKGFEKIYMIREDGIVWNLNTGRVLKAISERGYMVVRLNLNRDNRRPCKVHRLVAEAFIPNPENKPQVNHIDGNKENNHRTNLEWATAKENSIHRVRVIGHIHSTKCREANRKWGAIVGKMNGKRVTQKSIDGTTIREWESISAISNELNISRRGIGLCCQGKISSYKGFLFSV